MREISRLTRWKGCMERRWVRIVAFVVCIPLLGVDSINAQSLTPVTLSIATKTFQQVIHPIAQDRGYMKEEGIDFKLTFIEATPSIQTLMSGSIEFTASGTSALVALAKGGVPLKVILATNDRVLQWVLAKPNIASPKDLKGKKVATTGVAAAATFMLKQIVAKHGLDGNKDITIIDPGSGNQLTALLTGVADAAIVSPDQRYIGLDNGMKELIYFGNEVKNSWGTVATSDKIIKEQPKMVAGFVRGVLKAIRYVRQDREGTIAAMVKFSGIERTAAARVYDDLVSTFTRSGAVDEETQRNDLVIIRQVVEGKEIIPPNRAYDFSFALDADQQLNKMGWKP
jgi:ABC-type nitrate/sulfonate/bicarbonate transport system substrate-binding protein